LKPNLYIFTASFPYSTGETFLANELDVIAPYFEKILLLPVYNPSGNNMTRPVPANVKFEEPLLYANIIKRSFAGIFNFAPLMPHIRDLKNMFKKGKNLKYNMKQWYISLLLFRCLYSSKHFNQLKNNLTGNDILYFYWGLGQTSILPYITHDRTFVRIHGGEIEFERHHGYIPLIERTIKNAPHIIAISGLVKNKIEQVFNYKNVFINRLGVVDKGLSPLPDSAAPVRIVSCSNIIPIKRLHLIVDALSLIKDQPVEWIHFGNGYLLEQINTLVETKLTPNIKVEFKGRVSNNEILEFYKKSYVDLFVNVSSTEGIPVSIMEAMSFGIACFATDAGATAELVNNSLGQLVEIDFETGKLTDAIINARSKNKREKQELIKKQISLDFDARNNYSRLLKILNN
jgi:glycosyltransferase involved in cell wall biosynthesis